MKEQLLKRTRLGRIVQHHQKMKMGRAPSAIFKIDAYDERLLRHRSSPSVLKIRR
ncbi:hypothetical protein [Paenibacillus ginsengihumi]|uniref:hypothetical protein n=1 Tax=Paenibacillus ginsengihumi TaxID=431596 RepID=UPI00146E4CC3|nr:hypothetical protein [Paenibacillus ginsengihumi]